MWNTFKSTAKVLTRTPMLFIWAFAFPILLATIFMFMFASMDEHDAFDPAPVAVVADAAYKDSAFAEVVEELGATGDDRLLDVREVASKEEARGLVESGEVDGALAVDGEGMPSVIVLAGEQVTNSSKGRINATIVQTVADAYVQNSALAGAIARENPLLLADPDAVEQAFSAPAATEQVSLTHSAPKQTVRYYYALLGMAALFTSQVAMFAICQAQPNLSALGARRALGAVSRRRMLTATLLASAVLTFACLAAAFAFIRLVIGVDFGGREGLCLVALGVTALFATALGTLVGAVPKMSLGAKAGILTGITCLLSLFAGLYGEPCMQLADQIARDFPLSAMLNPAKLVTDLFYSLYYYDSLVPFAGKAALLIAFGAVLFGCAVLFIRRQRYDHL